MSAAAVGGGEEDGTPLDSDPLQGRNKSLLLVDSPSPNSTAGCDVRSSSSWLSSSASPSAKNSADVRRYGLRSEGWPESSSDGIGDGFDVAFRDGTKTSGEALAASENTVIVGDCRDGEEEDGAMPSPNEESVEKAEGGVEAIVVAVRCVAAESSPPPLAHLSPR